MERILRKRLLPPLGAGERSANFGRGMEHLEVPDRALYCTGGRSTCRILCEHTRVQVLVSVSLSCHIAQVSNLAGSSLEFLLLWVLRRRVPKDPEQADSWNGAVKEFAKRGSTTECK
jgi:hypothetical protein